MTQKDDPTIKEVLDSAANAIKRGDLETGKAGLRWVHKREPNNVLVWLWMSRCTENAEEKLECFNRVLAIDPTNKHALEGIRKLLLHFRGSLSAPAEELIDYTAT
jgi:hypothetical protein